MKVFVLLVLVLVPGPGPGPNAVAVTGAGRSSPSRFVVIVGDRPCLLWFFSSRSAPSVFTLLGLCDDDGQDGARGLRHIIQCDDRSGVERRSVRK
jgi:hypothetical protein